MPELPQSPGSRLSNTVRTLDDVPPGDPETADLRSTLLRIKALEEEVGSALSYCQQHGIGVEWVGSYLNHFMLYLVSQGVLTEAQYYEFQMDWLEMFRKMLAQSIRGIQQATMEQQLKNSLWRPGG